MRTVGYWLFVLLCLLSLAVAARTLLTPGIIPYHAEIMGGTAETLPPGVVTFYFAQRVGTAIVMLALAVVNAYLLFDRIRQGDERAALAYVLASTLTTAGVIVPTINFPPTSLGQPWMPSMVAFAVLMLAYFLWLPPRAKPPA
jgi:hypothetical protein